VDRSGDLPNEPVTAVAIDSVDDRVLWVGQDGFVFRSDDLGESFLTVLSFPRGLADDSNDDAAASALEGQGFIADPTTSLSDRATVDDELPDGDVDRADDADFDDLPAGRAPDVGADEAFDAVDISIPSRVEPGVRAFAFVPGSRGVVLVATPRGLWRTVDSGGSFVRVPIPGGARANDVRDVVVDPRRPSRLYVATAGGLFISRDGGASFDRGPGRTATVPGVCLAAGVVGDELEILYGTEVGLVRSRDGGATFTDLLLRGAAAFPVVHAVARAATSTTSGDLAYAATSLGVFVAERGAPIFERYPGFPNDPATALAVDPSVPGGIAVALRTGGHGVLFSNDAGLTLVDVDTLPAQQPLALARSARQPALLWVASERGLFRLEPGTGVTLAQDQARGLREQFAREPSLNRLTLQALRRRGLGPSDDIPLERAWWAAALPRIDARYQLDVGDTEQVRTSFLFRDASALPPFVDPDFDDSVFFGDGLNTISPSQQWNNTLWVTLSWDLDRLLMNPQAMSAARQIPLLANAERDVIDRVQGLYVQRRRLVAELYVAPRRATEVQRRERVLKELRLLELEAHLAALVGDDAFDPGRR
jgi:hypothetical protein